MNKKLMVAVAVVVLTLGIGMLIGAKIAFMTLPPDVSLLRSLKGEDLGEVTILAEKNHIKGGINRICITNAPGPKETPTLELTNSFGGKKESTLAHLVRKEGWGNKLELVFNDD